MGRAGRPQGPPKGSTEEANALAGFLRDLTAGMTVRELAERYHTSKTIWGEYRSGTKIIPLGRLNSVVRDRIRDERGRTTMLAKARRLYEAAITAEQTVRSAEDPGAARRQVEADRAESEKLVKALLQIITALTDPDEPVGAGPDAELIRQHLAEARHRLGVVREVQQAAERVLADTPERGEGEGRARAPGAGADDEDRAEDHGEDRDENRAEDQTEDRHEDRREDRHEDRLPAVSARGGLILQSALVHDEVEEQRTEVARLWQQIRPALTGSDIVQGIVLERLDTPLTSAPPGGTGVAGNADAPVTEIRPTAARPHRRRTQLILAAGVGAAVAAATAGVLLYALPHRHDAGPARTLSSPPQPPPSASGPAAGGPSASQSSSPTPEPSASSPRHEDARPDTESSAPAKGSDVTDPAGVYAVSEDGKVLQWSGTGKSWSSIGSDADSIVAGEAGLFRINESDGWISQYRPASKSWKRIGSPGFQFIQQGSTLYALRPLRDAVMRWDPDKDKWQRIGIKSAKLYAGPAGLFSTNPDTGRIWKYNGAPDNWSEIGNPGADFAVGNHLWGITPDHATVFQWTEHGDGWFQVGGAADKIYAGGAGMFIVRESTGQILKYNEEPFSWTLIGTAGADLIVTDHKVYRISGDHKTISRWSGHGTTWTTIGPSATDLAAVD
ncbi:serine/threonine protein kinase [Streptomyces bingchenggensis BCW-1]|uniref:Serine/threonine protein kinase n=1 Tax=Streptomyces bingchenggensis (strain BCW-1) TaxID=749414 RepID=D7C2Z1_STRBB|nr:MULTISPECIES: hypothetical protein [Streptomyces]ADI08053.1 serine/threonine protein kinase [Streptomyces bingchenggensis BCW-1]